MNARTQSFAVEHPVAFSCPAVALCLSSDAAVAIAGLFGSERSQHILVLDRHSNIYSLFNAKRGWETLKEKQITRIILAL